MVTGPEKASSDRGLVFVVQFASALSLGTLAGLLYSVKAITPRIQFQFSVVSVVSFTAAAVVSLVFWHVVFKLQDAARHDRPRKQAHQIWLAVLAGILGISLLAGFVYPLRDFSSEKQAEIGFGAVIALVFLSVLGLLFWRVVKYLEGDHGPE